MGQIPREPGREYNQNVTFLSNTNKIAGTFSSINDMAFVFSPGSHQSSLNNISYSLSD